MRILLIVAIGLTVLGLLVIFAPVNDAYNDVVTNQVEPITDCTTAYTVAGGAVVPNFNTFDHMVVRNLVILVIIGAIWCLFFVLGNVFKPGDDDNA